MEYIINSRLSIPKEPSLWYVRKYDYQSGKITVISTEMPSDIKDPNRLNHFPPYNISNFMKYLNKLSTTYK